MDESDRTCHAIISVHVSMPHPSDHHATNWVYIPSEPCCSDASCGTRPSPLRRKEWINTNSI